MSDRLTGDRLPAPGPANEGGRREAFSEGRIRQRSGDMAGGSASTPSHGGKHRRFFSRISLRDVLSVESDGERCSTRGGSSEGGGSSPPADASEARTRLLTKIEGKKLSLLRIHEAREKDLEEFYTVAKKIEDAGGFDNPQMARIRQHYEKLNKKFSAEEEKELKKLAVYQARLIELETGASPLDLSTSRSANVISGIRRTGANLREMTGTVISAPLELAQKLKSSFRSADNLREAAPPLAGDGMVGKSQFYSGSQTDESVNLPEDKSTTKKKSATLPADMRTSPPDLSAFKHISSKPDHFEYDLSHYKPKESKSADAAVSWATKQGESATRPPRRNDGRPALGEPDIVERREHLDKDDKDDSTPDSSSSPLVFVPRLDCRPVLPTPAHFTDETLRLMLKEIKDLRQHNIVIVEHMDKLQERVQMELTKHDKALMEERFKYQRLEDSFNEFIELHQAETAALKSELHIYKKRNLQLIASRIDYQYNDRFKRVEETLETTQNHMVRVENSVRSKLEIREGGPWYNALLLSGATIVLELLKIGLFVTAVTLDFFRPFTGTRTRAGIALLLMFLSFFLLKNADWLASFFLSSSTTQDASSSSANSSSATTPPTTLSTNPSTPPDTK